MSFDGPFGQALWTCKAEKFVIMYFGPLKSEETELYSSELIYLGIENTGFGIKLFSGVI